MPVYLGVYSGDGTECHGPGERQLTGNSILPALAFSLDMFSKTDMSYGVNEVSLASVLGAVIFSVL